jgi:hypothetical protein
MWSKKDSDPFGRADGLWPRARFFFCYRNSEINSGLALESAWSQRMPSVAESLCVRTVSKLQAMTESGIVKQVILLENRFNRGENNDARNW